MKYLCFIFVGMLVACEPNVETVYVDVHALRASSLYASDSVYAYMERYKDQNKDLAKSYYEKYKKEESVNPEKAVYYLKRSISVQPRPEAYKELALILGKLDRKEELLDLYRLFVYHYYIPDPKGKGTELYVFGEPDEDTYYNYLAATVMRYGRLYGEDIYLAREAGFNVEKIKERLIADPRVTIDRNSDAFKCLLLQFLSYDDLEAIAQKPESFGSFLASIKDSSSHFSIGQAKAKEFNYENFNGLNGEDSYMQIDFDAIHVFYLKEKQDKKDSWIKFNLKHRYQPFPSINAVIYAIDTSETACPLEMRHVYHRLATYDAQGKLVDSKIISLQSGEDLMTADVDNTTITTQLYKRSWKKPYKKNDFDNHLLDTRLLGTKKMVIQPDGTIQEELAETGG